MIHTQCFIWSITDLVQIATIAAFGNNDAVIAVAVAIIVIVVQIVAIVVIGVEVDVVKRSLETKLCIHFAIGCCWKMGLCDLLRQKLKFVHDIAREIPLYI